MGEAGHPRPISHGLSKQIGELAGVRPAPLALVQYQRHNHSQFALLRLLPKTLVPDAATILQQPSSPAALASTTSASGSPPGADAFAESSWLLPSRSARREPSYHADDEARLPYHLSCCRLQRFSRRSVSE